MNAFTPQSPVRSHVDAPARHEKPILFSAQMVRAILAEIKTQTRRVVKPQPGPPGPSHVYRHESEGWCTFGDNTGRTWKSPYSVGDRLWVKEAWHKQKGMALIIYAADQPDCKAKKTSPLFLPRRLSRITLEITGVRVQRLQSISEEDAKAEGCDQKTCAKIFDGAAGKVELDDLFYPENEETGKRDPACEDYCYECAIKAAKKLGKKWSVHRDCGCAMESDGPASCEKCGKPLRMSLTKYGVERELRIEDDPEGKEPEYFPVKNGDARIAHMIAYGIGDLRDEHLGRLAQIGFATLWDSINGKTFPWETNPWVWANTFKIVGGAK